jgi:adenylosuccinate synthase
MGANIVVGGFWGDEGKGLISAWHTFMTRSKGVFRGCGGANPEHGLFIGDSYIKTNQLPLGFILEECLIGIGPGTAVDVDKFLKEVNHFKLSPKKVRVDYRCPIITPQNIQEEIDSASMDAIGSTKSGTGIAMSHAALRIAPLAEDIHLLKPYLDDVPLLANQLSGEGTISLEGTQGTFLSRFHGDYPNVTSVDVTAPSIIAGVGLNWRVVDDVIVCVKALPTREGAGPMGDVEEFTNEEMQELGIVEYSSIIDPETGQHQIRRKAKGIDYTLLKRIIMLNGANKIALTFAEHVDPQIRGVTNWSELTPNVMRLIEEIENRTGVEVTLVNTGKQFSSMVSKQDDLPVISDSIINRLQSYR